MTGIYAKGGQGKAERWSHRLDASKPDRRVLKTTSVFWAPSSLSPDGPFLAYIAADPVSGIANSYVLDLQSGKMAITVRPGPPASFDTPRAWFDREFVGGIDLGRTWEVSRAGRRFLLMRGSRVLAQSREIVVVQNWFEELRRLAPVPR